MGQVTSLFHKKVVYEILHKHVNPIFVVVGHWILQLSCFKRLHKRSFFSRTVESGKPPACLQKMNGKQWNDTPHLGFVEGTWMFISNSSAN